MAPNGGALLFTSYDEDIRLHHPPQYRRIPINESDQDSPTFESVCLPVGGGLPFAAARRIQIAPGVSRLILGNGIHRIYKLAIAGHEWAPVVVTDMGSMETPDTFVDLPKDILLSPMSNPPPISDFTNEHLFICQDHAREEGSHRKRTERRRCGRLRPGVPVPGAEVEPRFVRCYGGKALRDLPEARDPRFGPLRLQGRTDLQRLPRPPSGARGRPRRGSLGGDRQVPRPGRQPSGYRGHR